MITISQNELDQVNFLIEQSIKGNHLLFDESKLASALDNSNKQINKENLREEPTNLVEMLIAQPSIKKQKEFLSDLNDDEYAEVVRIYFNMVEQHIKPKNTLLN